MVVDVKFKHLLIKIITDGWFGEHRSLKLPIPLVMIYVDKHPNFTSTGAFTKHCETSWRSVDSSSWQEDLHNSRPGSGRRYQLLDLTQTPRQPDRLRTTGLVGVKLESSPGDQTFFIKTTHNFLEADKSYSLQLFSGRFI